MRRNLRGEGSLAKTIGYGAAVLLILAVIALYSLFRMHEESSNRVKRWHALRYVSHLACQHDFDIEAMMKASQNQAIASLMKKGEIALRTDGTDRVVLWGRNLASVDHRRVIAEARLTPSGTGSIEVEGDALLFSVPNCEALKSSTISVSPWPR